MYRQLVQLPVIAEDLGAKAAEGQPVLQQYGIPGMRVTQFGFGAYLPASAHAPHNYAENLLAYTSTHDTNTTRGWFRSLNESDHRGLAAYAGLAPNDKTVTDHLMRPTLQSLTRLTTLPVQDILNLDKTHRINTPGGSGIDRIWQLLPNLLAGDITERLRSSTLMTGRVS